MAQSGSGIVLGSWPPPSADWDLVDRLRTAAREARTSGAFGADVQLDGIHRIRIDARLGVTSATQCDIEELDVALTGISATLLPIDPTPPTPPGPVVATLGEVVERMAGVLHSAAIVANPLLLEGTPVTLDARAQSVPMQWLRHPNDILTLAATESTEFSVTSTTGTAALSLRVADLPTLINRILAARLAEDGVSVSVLALDMSSPATDSIDLDALARVRTGAVGAKVRFRARMSVIEARTIQLDSLDLSSRNLVAGAMLAIVRRRLQEFVGRRIDLVEFLPPELPKLAVHVEVRQGTIHARATFG